jgi:hypothetical protein
VFKRSYNCGGRGTQHLLLICRKLFSGSVLQRQWNQNGAARCHETGHSGPCECYNGNYSQWDQAVVCEACILHDTTARGPETQTSVNRRKKKRGFSPCQTTQSHKDLQATEWPVSALFPAVVHLLAGHYTLKLPPASVSGLIHHSSYKVALICLLYAFNLM